MDFLKELDAEVLKVELIEFLSTNEIDVDSIEDFKERFVGFIKEDLSYGDCE